MPETNDSILVRQAQSGDFAAFEQLVSRHERRLYGLAWHLTHDHHDAQDVVQNTLLSAVEHLSDFRGDSAFGTWITRIATNHALKLLAKRKLRRGVPLDGDEDEPIHDPKFIADWREDPQASLDRQELRQVLDEGLAQLPEGQRIVFVLRDIQGMSVADTAQVVGITPGNVKVRLLRARLALREYLTQRFGDESRRQVPDHSGHDHSSLLARIVQSAERNEDAAVSKSGGSRS